jgi:hypothetical protein
MQGKQSDLKRILTTIGGGDTKTQIKGNTQRNVWMQKDKQTARLFHKLHCITSK